MFTLDPLLEKGPFSLKKEEKRALLSKAFSELTLFHYTECPEYRRILDTLRFDPRSVLSLEEMPFLPVRLFKNQTLSSVKSSEVVRTLQSSGTSGAKTSQISLDRETSHNQTRVLTRILSDFIGKTRLPMLIIDSKSALSESKFSARAAGILGFSLVGKDLTYALNEKMELDSSVVSAFLERFEKDPFLIFGLTYAVWETFLNTISKQKTAFNFENAILIHGGGWKKLEAKAVDNTTFKKRFEDVCGIRRIHNYYGMVEQTGSIFMECEKGFLHSSIFSEVLARDSHFTVCETGKTGLLQLFSLLPRSYPGHILLTEDLGAVQGEDDCACRRLGKYFRVHGRLEQSETRGCSDTLATF